MTVSPHQPSVSHWPALLVWGYATLWGVSLGHMDDAVGRLWALGGSLWLGSVLWSFPLVVLVLLVNRWLPELPELLCRWLLVNALFLILLV